MTRARRPSLTLSLGGALVAALVAAAAGCAASETQGSQMAGSREGRGPASAEPKGPEGPASPDGARAAQPLHGKVCTQMACANEAVIEAELAEATTGAGRHTFELEIDGVKKSCIVDVTVGSRADGTCSGGGVSLMMGSQMEQRTMSMGGMVGVTEVPVPGRMFWRLSVYGTPKQVRVLHKRATVVVVDRSESLQYREHRPNGPGCEPACQVARAVWKVS